MKTEDVTPTETADGTGHGPPAPPDRIDERARRTRRADLITAACGVLLVAAAVLIGRVIQDRDGTLFAQWPPFLASGPCGAGRRERRG
ncbi:membrane protein [Streptomyces badius]